MGFTCARLGLAVVLIGACGSKGEKQPELPAQILVEAVHAARGTDAEPLFPDVVLSFGFR